MRGYSWLLLIAFPILLWADPPAVEWNRTFGGPFLDGCHRVLQLPNGEFLCAGYMESEVISNYDIWLLWTNAAGDSLRSRIYDFEEHDFVLDIVGTTDGGYALLCYSENTEPILRLLRTDEQGDTLWSRSLTYAYSRGFIREANDGGFILLYSAYNPASAGSAAKLVRYNSDGDTLWTRIYDTPRDDECWGILQTDSGYVIVAESGYDETNGNLWIIYTNLQGDSTRSFWFPQGPDFSMCHSLHFTNDNGMILSGYRGQVGQEFTAWLLKMNLEGDTLWSRTYDSHYGNRWAVLATPLTDGGFLVTAYNQVMRADGQGNPLWQYDPNLDVYIMRTIQTADGGFMLTGMCDQDISNTDLWLQKLAPELAVDQPPLAVAKDFTLAAYPNPFNPVTTLSFHLPHATHTRLAVFDVSGRLVSVLADGSYNAGEQTVRFDGGSLTSGLYFVRLDAGGISQTRKIVLLK
ncbi:MAG: T9SS type A sorting domain-containing protein [Calditrichota bacterium]